MWRCVARGIGSSNGNVLKRSQPNTLRSNPSQHHGYTWGSSYQRRGYGAGNDACSDARVRTVSFSSLTASFLLGGIATAYLIHVYQDLFDADAFPVAEAESIKTDTTPTYTSPPARKSIIESSETTLEPRSGSAVPNWIQLELISSPSSSSSDQSKKNAPRLEPQQQLIGTSVRTVTVFGFLTYTLAVYADAVDLRAAWNSAAASVPTNSSSGTIASATTENAARADQTLIKLIEDAQNTRTVRIINYRKIDSSHFCHSLSTGLTDRWRRSGLDVASLEPNVAAFRSFFKTKDLPAGTIIDFAFRRGALRVFVNGVAVGTISDKQWEQQFLGMFLGDRARAESMRADMAAGVLKKVL
jgi:hypothetical protein